MISRTETQIKGLALRDRLKSAPVYSTLDRIGDEMGWQYGQIYGVRTNIRHNPKFYGGTIPYIEMGPTHHFIGFVWRGMPQWYARAIRQAEALADENWTRRLMTNLMTDEIIAETLDDNSIAFHSAVILEHHIAKLER